MSSGSDGTWRIGRIAGADINVRPSLLVMGLLLVAVFAPQFQNVSRTNPYVVALVFVVSLYASILAHELAHLFSAKAFGMKVPSVTLHLLGGETLIEGEYRSPWSSLVTSIVGPITSLVVGGVALWASGQLEIGVPYAVLWSLGRINIILGLFNLLPGLPLDGGHVLKAFVWAVTSSQAMGLVVAGWTGRVTAAAVLVWSLFGTNFRDSLSLSTLLIGVLVAGFLWQGAGAAIRHGSLLRRIERLVAADLAVDAPAPDGSPRISASLRGRDLLVAMAENPANSYVLVDGTGNPTGRLDAIAVDQAYRGGR